MKFKKCHFKRVSFFTTFLGVTLLCSLAIAAPKNKAEAMAELNRIKAGGTPQKGMSEANFNRLLNDSYTDKDKRIMCENNLRRIRAAKEEFLGANSDRIAQITTITKEDINPYIKKGMDSLVCKSQGKYAIGEKEVSPSCSVHGALQ